MKICDCCQKAGKVQLTDGLEHPGGIEMCLAHAEQLKEALDLVVSLFRVKPAGYNPTDAEARAWVNRIVPYRFVDEKKPN